MSASNSRHSIAPPKPEIATLLVVAFALATFSSSACGMRTADTRTIGLAVARSPFTYLPVRAFAPLFSADGRMDAELANGVKRVLSVSLENVRAANLDLAQTYTDSFLPAT